MSARPRFGLGDDTSILNQVFAGQTGAPAAPLVQQTVQQAMSQGLLWTKEDCTGIPASSNVLGTSLSAAGGVAIKIAPGTGPAAPFVLAAGGVMELFGALFGHHAAKVKQEQQIICAVVAAANDTFTSIDQLVQTGQISPQQGSQALDGMYGQFQQQVQGILKMDSGHCNAACFILQEAKGVIAKKKEQYAQVMPANAPAGSYQLTCRNVVVNGDLLTAECRDRNGNWQTTSLPAISACNGIMNNNGQLQCQAAATPGSNPVAALSSSFGVPSWAVWGIGGLVAAKVFGLI